jgi:hypothetical protein
MNTKDEIDPITNSIIENAFDPDEYPSKIMPRDWYRLLRTLAIHEYHIAQLFKQTHGIKDYSFDEILKAVAGDFDVPYEKLRDVKFARFDH